MFVQCAGCGWTSPEANSVDELVELVAAAGGHLVGVGEDGADECPACHGYDELSVEG
jgi:hypothetical protein